MSADETQEYLDPDDPVGNALLDSQGNVDYRVLRVLNYHSDGATSSPNWQDFRTALETCRGEIAAKWPSKDKHGEDIVLRATEKPGVFERVPVRGSAVAHVSQVTADTIEEYCALRGHPRLVPLDDVLHHFEDGDAR